MATLASPLRKSVNFTHLWAFSRRIGFGCSPNPVISAGSFLESFVDFGPEPNIMTGVQPISPTNKTERKEFMEEKLETNHLSNHDHPPLPVPTLSKFTIRLRYPQNEPITFHEPKSNEAHSHPPNHPFIITLLHTLLFVPPRFLNTKNSKTTLSAACRQTASMASLASSTALVSEMLGSRLNHTAAARSAPSASSPSTSKIFALFSKKAPAKKAAAAAPVDDELSKWYGPDRRIFLPEGLLDRSEVPEYLTGEVAGDYGYDPFGLGKKPENFEKYQAFELIHARWAMLGAAGAVIPEAFNKFGANCGPEAVWFKTGALLLDGNTLNYFGKPIPINLALAVIAEVVLLGGAEYYRITNGLNFEDKLHPGGPFDPLGLAEDPDQFALLKVKEIKNGRLAMFAMFAFFIQAYVTGEGPVENLSAHLSDPFGNNLLTVLSGSIERTPTL